MTVICIAGMHRSGTSMVSRLLNLCGLYLGREEELMPSNAYNVDGYWENLRFVGINDNILSSFSNRWDIPPEQTIDSSSVPIPLREQAQKLLRSFEGQKNWGWKDPRTSLTLPFWYDLIPDLKVIICLRNPMEVADSLTHRDKFTKNFGLNLWQTYNERLLSSVEVEGRIVTHYDAYFSDPSAELHRLLKFVGIASDDDTIQNACKTTLVSLRHNQSSFEALIANASSLAPVNLYAELCSQAGSVYWNSLSHAITEDSSNSHDSYEIERRLLIGVIERDPLIQLLTAHISEKEKCIQSLQSQILEKEDQISSAHQTLSEKESRISGLEGQISSLERQISDWRQVVLERESQITGLHQALTSIYSSRTWQLIQFFSRIHKKISGR